MKENNKLKILIVVDMQNDFITGVLSTPEARAIVPKIAALPENYDWTFYTRDTHNPPFCWEDHPENLAGIPLHCKAGTKGWELIDVLKSVKNMYVNSSYVNKEDFGYRKWEYHISTLLSFFSDEMFVQYEDMIQIDVCGVCTDMCVVTNALGLKNLYPRSKIRVLSDCCAGSTPEMHQKALDVMRKCLIEVV